MEFGLPAAAAASVGVAWVVMRAGGARRGLDHVITAGLTGLLFGRLVAMVSVGVNPLTHPLDILIVRGGVNTVAASLGALASLIWSTRADRRLLDLIAPGAVAGLAMWHAACLWRSSCLGTVSDVPWGWSLPGSALTRHPVEIYAAAAMAIGAVLLTRIAPGRGIRSALALSWVAGSRLVTEPLRPSLGGGPVWWYAAAVLVGLALAVIFDRRSSHLRHRVDEHPGATDRREPDH